MTQQGQGAAGDLEAQDAITAETIATVRRIMEAINRHDVDAVMAAMTDDCVMESAFPLPDGTRYEGQAVVRARWEEIFSASPELRYETEEMFAVGDRCVFRWIGHRTDKDGKPEHSRGVDIVRVRNGKVAEELVYTKR